MNERIRKLALESHLLNYVDNETPRRYFVSGSAEEDEVHLFALKLIQECARVLHDNELGGYQVEHVLKEHFGVE